MKNTYIVAVIVLAGFPLARPAHAEEDTSDSPAPNSVYAEGLGAGLAYSINYERVFADQIVLRGGLSYLTISATAFDEQGQVEASANATFMTFPVTVSYFGLRGGKHSLEVGGGATLAYASGDSTALGVSASGSGVGAFGTFLLGYRLHPVGRAGFQFRVGAMLLAAPGFSLSNPDPDAFGTLPWFYLSCGASF
jgi:hypothetical protein